jgi:uncharacterized protein
MSLSQYTIFLKNFLKKEKLIYNCLSGAFVKVDDELLEMLQKNISKIPSKFKDELKKGNFIIEDEVDEIGLWKVLTQKTRYSSNLLALTILPTYSCNFRCTYCYEKHEPIFMNNSIREELMRFISLWASDQKIEKLSVSWFGGEPLLAKNLIISLTKKLLRKCKEKNWDYQSNIVTNGSLLTKNVAQELKETCKVSSAQVTLDGPPSVHNKRRPFVDGKGTFDIILNNLKDAFDYLNIMLRVNIDKENVSSVAELLDILKNEGFDKTQRFVIDFSPTAPVTELCMGAIESFYTQEAFSKAMVHLYQEAFERNFGLTYPSPLAGCGAVAFNSFVIDPLGDIYKCWSTVGNKQETIGNICTLRNLWQLIGTPNFLKWMMWDPFAIEKCRKCKVLPLCMGGCPYKRIVGEAVNKGYCQNWKYNLKEILSLYYRSRGKK